MPKKSKAAEEDEDDFEDQFDAEDEGVDVDIENTEENPLSVSIGTAASLHCSMKIWPMFPGRLAIMTSVRRLMGQTITER
jgi:hypothetical protein